MDGVVLATTRVGHGPPIVLVHGGAGPEMTWRAQRELGEHWTVVTVWRRGFDPSPASDRQDFEVDAADIGLLLADRGPAHLVGFSYGGVGAALAAIADPKLVLSLTLIEPAFFGLLADDPEIAAMAEVARAAIEGDGTPEGEREFFAIAGLNSPKAAAELARAREIARGMRQPIEARPDFTPLRAAEVPALIVSGGHNDGIERICDETAAQLGAHREIVKGAGHAAQSAPGFNVIFEEFLTG